MCIRDRYIDDVNITGTVGFNDIQAGTTGLALMPNPTEGEPVSYTHLRAHETVLDLVCRLLLEKQKGNS